MNGRIRIGTKIDTGEFDKQVKYIENRADDLKATLEDDKLDFSIRLQYEAELERLENSLKRLENRQLQISLGKIKNIEYESTPFKNNSFALQKSSIGNEYSSMGGDLEYICDKFSDIREEVKEVSKEISKSEKNTKKFKNQTADINLAQKFEKSTQSIRRFALSLLSVGTIWGVISKASSTYLSTDDKTTKQMEANWVGLSTILGPIITGIVNMMKKAVTGILYFISCLTRTDYIAKANAAALQKQTKATNDLAKANQRATGSFDEMDIFSPNTSDSSSKDEALPPFSLDDISDGAKKKIEEIADAVRPIYNFLKDMINWAIDHPDVVVGILGGLALLDLLTKIIGGPATGLLGIKGLLTGLATMGVISIVINISSIVSTYNQVKKTIDKWDDFRVQNHNQSMEHIDDLKAEGLAASKNSKEIQEVVDALREEAESHRSLAEGQQKSADSRSALEKATDKLTGTEKTYNDSIKAAITRSMQSIVAMGDLYKQGKLNEEQTRIYKEELIKFQESLKSVQGTYSSSTEGLLEYTQMMSRTQDSLDDVNKTLGDSPSFFSTFNNIAQEVFSDVTSKIDDTKDHISIFDQLAKNLGIHIDDEDMQEIKDEIDNGIQTGATFDELISNLKVKIDNGEIKDTDGKLSNLLKLIESLDLTKKIKVGADLTSFKSILSEFLNTKFKAAFSLAMGAIGLNLTFPQIKLATGAIVNNPGRGVLYGNTIRGEAGKEGILPLTNSTTMVELGREIGKWITINQTNNTYLDSRLINRQLVKAANDTSFATNGRR